jgi:hypothetical protein
MEVTDNLYRKHPDNLHVAVLLSDGKNDPPPGHQSAEDFDLAAITERYEDRPWYVYYISLGSEPDPDLETAIDTLRHGETKESIEARDLGDEMRAIQESAWRERVKNILRWIGIIVASVIAAGVLLLLLAKARSRQLEMMLMGNLLWAVKLDRRQSGRVDLSELEKKTVKVGTNTEHDVIVPATGIKSGLMFTMKNRLEEGMGIPHLEAGEGFAIRHRDAEVTSLRLYDTDEFEIGDIVFTYRNGELPRRDAQTKG